MQTWQGEGGRGIPKQMDICIPYLVKRGIHTLYTKMEGVQNFQKVVHVISRDSWDIGPFHSGNKTSGNEPWYTFQSRTVQSRTFQSQDGSVPHFSDPRRFSPGMKRLGMNRGAADLWMSPLQKSGSYPTVTTTKS